MRRAPRWPTADQRADPFADEPAVLPGDPPIAEEDLGWDDYLLAQRVLGPSPTGPRSYGDYQARAQALLALLDAAEGGAAPAPEALREHLEALQISPEWTLDHRTEPLRGDPIPSDADLARIAADLCPAASMEAAERVLGPLALHLDPRLPAQLRTLQVALAAFALIPPDGDARQAGERPGLVSPGLPPLARWFRRKPIPSVATRRAFRAIARTPWVPWRLNRELGDGRVILSPLVPLEARWLPDGPVLLDAGAPIRAPRAGDLVFARVVHGPDGPTLRTALALPAGPPPARINAWIQIELLRTRLRQREAPLEEVLRTRGFVLARRLCEWAWLHGDDDPYAAPTLYDLEYRDHDEDLDWYRDLAVRSKGPVLELGCGSGRLTLAIARSGVEVHGIDRSEPMLEQLRAKRSLLPPAVALRIQLEQGDFRYHDAPPIHPLVLIPFNALHHCADIDELTAVLTQARRALAPGGKVAFDCYLPDLSLYDRDPDRRYEPRQFVHPATGERLQSWEQGWWDPETRVHHVLYVYVDPEGTETHAHLQLRVFELSEIRTAVHRAGLQLIGQHRDFEGRPLSASALKYVALAEARADRNP